jgi:hypothetical protein
MNDVLAEGPAIPTSPEDRLLDSIGVGVYANGVWTTEEAVATLTEALAPGGV